ncbi:NAD(P)H-dependent oxidoreductase [Qingshengfaniella alkalisoli]|uniref:NAD(P)H-dependent oxidoreductase n=1 Tax=Qingshengfaniella alkalisoli TaxID=2599296 RepID=A0A5B8I8I3_9RHOB|nr:NAD(P)H-dependent oxidoreductase [Qingshengfaniella alkalisoli]QDY70089.1 NAD(P)H-dependent oxidoreductase [Qingshengfaniella alkalisoli]
MHILFVLAHPEPKSFNAALVQSGKRALESDGHTVEISDLYGEHFDPVEHPRHYADRADNDTFSALAEQRHAYKSGTLAPEITREIERLERADLVVFQFPIWWHSVPAMIKGWCDRVFVSGGLYTSRMRYGEGYFRGKRAMCSVTSGAPADTFVPGGRGGEISQILWSTHFSLHYMGFDVLPPHGSFGIQGHGYRYADDGEFRDGLESAKDRFAHRLLSLDEHAPLQFPSWEDWDDMGRPLNTKNKNAKEALC